MTPIDGASLLAKLGSGITPTDRSQSLSAGTDALDFAGMLSKAKAGELRSGRAVEVDPAVDVSLTDDQLARISEAADRIESSGSSKAIVLIDGRAIKIDVMTRRVIGEVDMQQAVATGIDAVAVASPSASEEAEGVEAATDSLARLAGNTVNSSLRKLLGD